MNTSITPLLPNHPSVVLTRKLPPEIEARFTDLFASHLNESDYPLSKGQLIKAV